MSDQNPPDYEPELPPTGAETAAEQAAFFTPRSQGLWSRLKRLTGTREKMRLLPVLIKVYAGFSKMGGLVAEEEIESSLGFLRYDYPESMFSQLQDMYRVALREPQDLNQVAQELATQLSVEAKILLAVQVYLLISHNKIQGSSNDSKHKI